MFPPIQRRPKKPSPSSSLPNKTGKEVVLIIHTQKTPVTTRETFNQTLIKRPSQSNKKNKNNENKEMEGLSFKTPERPSERTHVLPMQHFQEISSLLNNGSYAGALRALSVMVSSRYLPKRDLYAEIWSHMLSAKSSSDALQCYEALKLLQAAFPPGRIEGAWCPRSGDDYALLLECLQSTRPEAEEDEEEEERPRSVFPQWHFLYITHASACPIAVSEKVTRLALGSKPPLGCKKSLGCQHVTRPSPHFPLLLQYLVALLAEDARTLPPSKYMSDSAAMQLLWPGGGDMSRWQEVAEILLEGCLSLFFFLLV